MFRAALLAGVLIAASTAFGFLSTGLPRAAIEYDPVKAAAIHGAAEAFNKAAPVHFRDVTPGDTTHWFTSAVRTLSTVHGYAHVGSSGLEQAAANARIARLQIWRWRDVNGNGQADVGDAMGVGGTTRWELVYARDPDGSDPSTPGANVIGWQVSDLSQGTSDYHSNLLQGGATLSVGGNESWLFLIRVVDIVGNTNLFNTGGGTEQWDNGDTGDGIGSDVPNDKYVDQDGNTPGLSDGRIPDLSVVWVYVPKF